MNITTVIDLLIGYSSWRHESHGLVQEVTTLVAPDAPVTPYIGLGLGIAVNHVDDGKVDRAPPPL